MPCTTCAVVIAGATRGTSKANAERLTLWAYHFPIGTPSTELTYWIEPTGRPEHIAKSRA